MFIDNNIFIFNDLFIAKWKWKKKVHTFIAINFIFSTKYIYTSSLYIIEEEEINYFNNTKEMDINDKKVGTEYFKINNNSKKILNNSLSI